MKSASFTFLILLSSVLMLSACASVTAESTQTIALTTEPEGAICTLTNKVGSLESAPTPAKVNVQRSFSPLKIKCKQGKRSATHTLEPFTRGRAYGNILLLGIPAYVDAATGAGYEYRPDAVHLKLHPMRVPPKTTRLLP
jgi:hypothetical protein